VVGVLAVFAPAPPDVVAPTRTSSVERAPAAPAAAKAQAHDKHARAAPHQMPERALLPKPKGDLFGTQSWEPPPKPVVGQPPPPPPPQPPAMTYRFAGRFVQDGRELLYVSNGDRPVAVKAGDLLDGYVVESITPNAITLLHKPLEHRERIFIPPAIPGEGAAPTGPMVPFVRPPSPAAPAIAAKPLPGVARVRWEGPAQVKFGANFSVALRVESDQPISGSPMQIRFDPALLEPVAVRPGKRYAADGARGFVYRVNADGSILVSALSKSGTPGASPASSVNNDPELLVLTFKPKKPGVPAEIRLASLSLQGTGGKALVHGGLAPFRVTVTP